MLQIIQHRDWIPLQSIERWGFGILQVDTHTGLFRALDEQNALKAQRSLEDIAAEVEQERNAILSLISEPASEEACSLPQCEDLLPVLFPEVTCSVAGTIIECCNPGKRPCKISRSGIRKLQTPVIGVSAPVFLRVQLYKCKTHNSRFTARSELKTSESTHEVQHDYCRIGNYCFTDAALTKILLSSMDMNSGKQIRRDFLLTWGTAGIEAIRGMLDLNRIHTRYSGKTVTFLLDRLAAYLPGNSVFSNVQLLLYTYVIKPNIAQYDIALAILDGQIIRYDVTFGAAKFVYAAETNKAHRGPIYLTSSSLFITVLDRRRREARAIPRGTPEGEQMSFKTDTIVFNL